MFACVTHSWLAVVSRWRGRGLGLLTKTCGSQATCTVHSAAWLVAVLFMELEPHYKLSVIQPCPSRDLVQALVM